MTLPRTIKGRIGLGLAIVGGLLALALAQFTVNRLLAPARRVQITVPADPPEDLRVRPDTLRIAVYNIAHGRGPSAGNWDDGDRTDRLQAIADELRAAKPDIVVLNEVDFDALWSRHVNQAEFIAEAAGFPYRVEQRNVDAALPFAHLRFGNAVLSHRPIRAATALTYPPMSGWESRLAGQKQGAICDIDLGGGETLRLVPVHLEHRDEPTRIASIQRMIDLADTSDIPVLLAGDFNSSRVSHPYAEPTAQGETAIDLLLASERFVAEPSQLVEPAFTFPASGPNRAIDWVLAPPGWTFASHTVRPLTLSDHCLIIVDLTLPHPSAAPQSDHPQKESI